MDFHYSVGWRNKTQKVYADERINAEMKSLSILCVGGRGRGGAWSQKSKQIKKGGPLALYSFYKILFICRQKRRRPRRMVKDE
jgi:hypothetical protein